MKVPICGSSRATSSASPRILAHTGSTFWIDAWDLGCCCAIDRLSRIRAVVLAQVGRGPLNATHAMQFNCFINELYNSAHLPRERLNGDCRPGFSPGISP